MTTLPKRRSVDSQVTMTEIVLPSHTNALGTIFGGQLMAWIDVAAAIAAIRHARTVCVTASIDALHFIAPVKLGQHVCIFANVNFTHKTSMEIGVRLEAEDPRTGVRRRVAKAYLTFVALDNDGKPTTVPEIVPESADEKRRFKEAKIRREARLKLKEDLMKS
ncbi:MAG: acyl-CoA thioesterase [Bacteriovoracia bacterium]